MIGYFRTFERNKTMSFKISDKKLLKKYNQIWKRLKIEFDSKPVYGDDNIYIKTKIVTYNGIMFTNFKVKKCLKRKHHARFCE